MQDYILITDLCKKYNKQAGHFKEYIVKSSIVSDIGFPITDLIKSEKGGVGGGRTYIYYKLQFHFILWCIPKTEQATFVANIINELANKKAISIIEANNQFILTHDKKETVETLIDNIIDNRKKIDKLQKTIDTMKNKSHPAFNKTLDEIIAFYGNNVLDKMIAENLVTAIKTKKGSIVYRLTVYAIDTKKYFKLVANNVYKTTMSFVDYINNI